MSDAAPISALIVDDEPLARRGVRLHLDAAGGFNVVGESASGRQAVADIAALHPQVVFLDVQMPGLNGFDVVDRVGLGNMPVTVFITAYDEYALKAFDARAVDYLLKPLDAARFAEMAERVRSLVGKGSAPQKLVLRDGARTLLIAPDEIDYVQADGDYVRLYFGGRGHLVRHTISALEERLDPAKFARIHRSTIVNLARVRETSRQGDRAFLVVLLDGTTLRASRRYAGRLVG